MKIFGPVLIAIILISTSFAQLDLGVSLAFPREITDVCNSAGVVSGQTWFNTDLIDTLNDDTSTTIFPVSSASVHTSINGGNTWLSLIGMSNIGGTYYEDTWEANRTNAATGAVEYYISCETDSTLATECPDNSPTSFPLADNKSADLGAGDVNNLTIDHHGRTDTWNTYDIQSFRGGYDSDEFFFRVTLAGGWDDNHQDHSGWPWNWWDVWHILAIPILNNESEFRDSLFFAALICDINLLVIDLDDGLYKFWKEADPSAGGDDDPMNNYQRLGDLDFSSGPDGSNDFSIRFPISWLTDNGFGSWPNATDGFGTGCATVSVWLVGLDSVAFHITDATKAAGLYCHTHQYTIGTNSAPTLVDAVSHSINRDTTWVDFSCTYTDTDNNLPTTAQLEIDDGSRTLYNLGTPDHVYDDGSLFERSFTFRCAYEDTFRYQFLFNDGAGVVSTGWVDYLVPQDIHLILSTADWTIADTLSPMEPVVMGSADGIQISNIGNVTVDLGLAVSVPFPGWILSDHINWDTTTVYGHFNDEADPPVTFDADDIITEALTWAEGSLLGGGEHLSFCVDGANSEKLWMKFVVPRYYADFGDQTMTVQLWARTDLP